MPIFEYLCSACGKKFEKIVLGQGPSALSCPKCGGAKVERLHSRFAAVGSSKSAADDFSGWGSGPEGGESDADDLAGEEEDWDGGPGGFGEEAHKEPWGEDDGDDSGGPDNPEDEDLD